MKGITALMVHDEEETFRDLKRRVSVLGIPSLQLRTFVEIKYFLKRLHHPALIFTATALPDGTWADVVEAAKNAAPPCPVIVVSRFVDLSLYLEALQKGAADFIVTPFTTAELESIIRSATTRLAESPDQARSASDRRPASEACVAGAEDRLPANSQIGHPQAEVTASAASAR
ncbi:MAG: hypothetical protein ACRD2G_15090 [Terriglobia bacterium]